MRGALSIIVVTIGLAVAGCGGDEETCGVTSEGTKLCGSAAAAWCSVIEYPTGDRVTDALCKELADEYSSVAVDCLERARNSGDPRVIRASVKKC